MEGENATDVPTVAPSILNEECQDVPGAIEFDFLEYDLLGDTYRGNTTAGCDNLLIRCDESVFGPEVMNCCKCKKECCGERNTWNTMICGAPELPDDFPSEVPSFPLEPTCLGDSNFFYPTKPSYSKPSYSKPTYYSSSSLSGTPLWYIILIVLVLPFALCGAVRKKREAEANISALNNANTANTDNDANNHDLESPEVVPTINTIPYVTNTTPYVSNTTTRLVMDRPVMDHPLVMNLLVMNQYQNQKRRKRKRRGKRKNPKRRNQKSISRTTREPWFSIRNILDGKMP